MNNPTELTPSEALAIVDKATSMLHLNRADHVQIANAVNVLAETVKEHEALLAEKNEASK